MERSLYRKKQKKTKKREEFTFDLKVIQNYFNDCFLFYARRNQAFFELLYFDNKQTKLNIVFISVIFEYFFEYYLHKAFSGLYNRKKKIKKEKKKRGRIINKKKQIYKFKHFRKNFYKKKFSLKKEDILKSKVVRYFKNNVEGRLPVSRNPLRFKNLVFTNIVNFDNFGIKVFKKKKKITSTGKFHKYSIVICHKFFDGLLLKIHKDNKFFDYSFSNQKFYKRAFNFCLFQDIKIRNNKRFLIKEDDEDDVEDIEKNSDIIKFYSGLTAKITLKRRNCFFHIWDNTSGFTLAKISAGVFGYFYKKIYKKYKQFEAFIKFFKCYFNSIIISYRKKVFFKFKFLRRKFTKDLKKKQNLKFKNLQKKKTKKKAKHKIRFAGISFLFFYRSKLNLTFILEMRRAYFQSTSLFNVRWFNLFSKLKYMRNLYKNIKFKKLNCLFRIFNSYAKLKIYYSSYIFKILKIKKRFNIKKKNKHKCKKIFKILFEFKKKFKNKYKTKKKLILKLSK